MADASEPGAPIPKDEIDPELVSLRPRTQVGLVTSLSVVVFCAYLGVRLWGDFRFAGEGAARDATVAQVVAGELAADAHVAVPAPLERSGAVRVRLTPNVPGFRVVPVAGTGDRLWVVLDGDGWTAPRPVGEPGGDRHTGRLRRLSDLPFEGAFRAQVRRAPPPRFVTAGELRRAHAAGDAALATVTGDRLAVAPGDEVEVVVVDPDAVVIVGSFNERFPDAEAWRRALAAAGVAPAGDPIRQTDAQAWFDVRRPGALAAAPAALEAAGLWGARVQGVPRRHRAPWRDLAVGEAGVTIAGTTLPWASVEVAAVHAARPLPDDPWVLVVGDAPADYWYVRPLYVALGLFAALFAWALVRTGRRELLAPRAPARA